MDKKTRKTLQKQLQLLSERSKSTATDADLADLTKAMIELAKTLSDPLLG